MYVYRYLDTPISNTNHYMFNNVMYNFKIKVCVH